MESELSNVTLMDVLDEIAGWASRAELQRESLSPEGSAQLPGLCGLDQSAAPSPQGSVSRRTASQLPALYRTDSAGRSARSPVAHRYRVSQRLADGAR